MYNGAQFLSRMFRPATAIYPKKSALISKSHKLMLYSGLIHGGTHGTFVLSPSLVRSVEKLGRMVDAAMRRLGAEKIVMPALGDIKLWQKSGRWDTMGPEMFRLKDRHGTNICLSPTNEEEVTSLLASVCKNISHKNLPIRLYQTTTKFRDEAQPCYGLLRAREFLMKDLYTFDESQEAANHTYNEVISIYKDLFASLKIPFHQVKADTGLIGGNYSHEFHIAAEIGEDVLHTCTKCDVKMNAETDANRNLCPECGDPMTVTRAIEVGHCFSLGHRYSQPFEAVFKTKDNKEEPMVMGCFGIGFTRLIAASLEALSTEEELRWPLCLAPYRVAVVLPKEGANDALPENELIALLQTISSLCPEGDLLIDDRPKLTIGRKLLDLRRLGVPLIVVAKIQNKAHGIEVLNVYSNETITMSPADVVSFIASELLGSGRGEEKQELKL